MGCYICYSEEGTGRGPPGPLLAVPNVTAHPLTAIVPITVLLYDGMLWGFNAAIKGLNTRSQMRRLYAMMLSVCLSVCSSSVAINAYRKRGFLKN